MIAGNGESCITGRELFKSISKSLERGGIENANGESRFILEHLTGRDYFRAMSYDEPLLGNVIDDSRKICERRIAGEPLQYILGDWDFYGMTFKVGKGVLIPRADTETLAEEAIRLREGFDSTNYIDLCSGSGCIAAAVAKYIKGIKGTAIEKSPQAFRYLKENLERLAPEIKPVLLDALLPETAAKYRDLDIITSNPPYLTADDMMHLQREVSYEPDIALFGGDDGLMFYQELTRVWKDSLKSGGVLLFEVGMSQYNDVMKILCENGFCDISYSCDLSGVERVVMGKKP